MRYSSARHCLAGQPCCTAGVGSFLQSVLETLSIALSSRSGYVVLVHSCRSIGVSEGVAELVVTVHQPPASRASITQKRSVVVMDVTWHAAVFVTLVAGANCRFTSFFAHAATPVDLDVHMKEAAVLNLRVLVLAGLHSSSFVPEGYAYIRHSWPSAEMASISKQESKLPASLPVRSTGLTAFVDVKVSKQAAGQQQRSADKQHETLMFTHEGHLYTKP